MLHEPGKKSLESLPKLLQNRRDIQRIILTTSQVETLWMRFCEMYNEVLAAGCVIKNRRGNLLWIKRNGRWDLPKGKVEHQEAIQDAAIREVHEETGIESITIEMDLGTTFHTYEENGQRILKTTFWFLARHEGDDTVGNPQQEEGITEVAWHRTPIAQEILDTTFPSLRGLLTRIPS